MTHSKNNEPELEKVLKEFRNVPAIKFNGDYVALVVELERIVEEYIVKAYESGKLQRSKEIGELIAGDLAVLYDSYSYEENDGEASNKIQALSSLQEQITKLK